MRSIRSRQSKKCNAQGHCREVGLSQVGRFHFQNLGPAKSGMQISRELDWTRIRRRLSRRFGNFRHSTPSFLATGGINTLSLLYIAGRNLYESVCSAYTHPIEGHFTHIYRKCSLASLRHLVTHEDLVIANYVNTANPAKRRRRASRVHGGF
jgi:hypothetical protein